jgi:hypothetical protein
MGTIHPKKMETKLMPGCFKEQLESVFRDVIVMN